MVNLFDIARQAESGAGFDALSRQFGLDPTQTQRAVEALLPAFSLAFQRSATDPAIMARLMAAIGSGQYAPYFDALAGPNRAPDGQAILGELFRTPDAARQVATQAAAMTGIGAQVLQHMMPVLAGVLVGGMFRYASLEGMADLLRRWADALQAAGRAAAPPPPPPANPWAAWADLASAMTGMPAAAPRREVPPDPVQAWTAAMTAAMGGAAPAAPKPPAKPATLKTTPARLGAAPAPLPGTGPARTPPGTEPPKTEPNPFDMLSRMFETGREVQEQHLAALTSIMDRVWGTGRPR